MRCQRDSAASRDGARGYGTIVYNVGRDLIVDGIDRNATRERERARVAGAVRDGSRDTDAECGNGRTGFGTDAERAAGTDPGIGNARLVLVLDHVARDARADRERARV